MNGDGSHLATTRRVAPDRATPSSGAVLREDPRTAVAPGAAEDGVSRGVNSTREEAPPWRSGAPRELAERDPARGVVQLGSLTAPSSCGAVLVRVPARSARLPPAIRKYSRSPHGAAGSAA